MLHRNTIHRWLLLSVLLMECRDSIGDGNAEVNASRTAGSPVAALFDIEVAFDQLMVESDEDACIMLVLQLDDEQQHQCRMLRVRTSILWCS